MRLDVRERDADAQHDCGHGEIAGPLTLSQDHRFDARGMFVREGPGPIRVGRVPFRTRRDTKARSAA